MKTSEHPMRRAAGKRRSVWIISIAVFLPLIVLMSLQYRWLANLKKASTIAGRATMENYLHFIVKRVEIFYTKNAEVVLNIPTDFLVGDQARLLKFYKKRIGKKKTGDDQKTHWYQGVSGAKYLFNVSFSGDRAWRVMHFDPERGSFTDEVPKPVAESISWACFYWQILAKKGVTGNYSELHIDKSDPSHPLILNVITDEQGKIAGVAGMVVDVDFFKEKLLPSLISKIFAKIPDMPNLHLVVRDQHDQPVLVRGTGPVQQPLEKSKSDVFRNFDFIFNDWTVTIHGGQSQVGQWADTNFGANMTLALVLAMALCGGLIFVLRTAAHEMQVSSMKNEFVSNVSHELRTPVASIRVFGELLRSGKVADPDKVVEYGCFIETEGRRLSRLINNILDFSKIESGQKVYQFEQADLEEILSRVVNSFETRLAQSDFKIEYHPPGDRLPPMWVDSDALTQVFFNLLDNSVKYSNGGKRIAVSLKREEQEILLSIRDWGLGIAKAEQEKIFERFHRVSTGLVHDVKGSGLGLSIVKHVVEAHGGSVQVESAPGKGATFTIRLPILDKAQEHEVKPTIGPQPT